MVSDIEYTSRFIAVRVEKADQQVWLVAYMTAGTHDRLAFCTMYPVIGSVIF